MEQPAANAKPDTSPPKGQYQSAHSAANPSTSHSKHHTHSAASSMRSSHTAEADHQPASTTHNSHTESATSEKATKSQPTPQAAKTQNNHKTPSQSAANGNRGANPLPSHARLPQGPSAAVPPQSAWSIVRLAVGVPASARASRFGAGLTLLPRLFSRLLRLILRSFDMSRNYGCNPLEYML